MTTFLLDEMFPAQAATLLRDAHGRDAVHVREVGLAGRQDAEIAAFARAEDRAVVTENVADFSRERDVVLLFMLKSRLPAGGAQASALASALDAWARANPEPYLGVHWPRID
ncbi:MAG TPA: DUF5615 family PIN-like protein [Nocardioidaceae bacterium]|nr:DUF5615 family PIN-like protein [Nocardioidaceae bacterium]